MSVEVIIRADTLREDDFAAANTNRMLLSAHSAFVSPSSSPRVVVNEVDIDEDASGEITDEDNFDNEPPHHHHHIWKRSRLVIVKNLFILAVACMAMQAAFLVNNSSSRLVVASSSYYQPTATGAFVVLEKFVNVLSCFVVPQYLIAKIGTKSTVFVSFLSYLVFYMTTRFYPLTYVSHFGVFLNEGSTNFIV